MSLHHINAYYLLTWVITRVKTENMAKIWWKFITLVWIEPSSDLFLPPLEITHLQSRCLRWIKVYLRKHKKCMQACSHTWPECIIFWFIYIYATTFKHQQQKNNNNNQTNITKHKQITVLLLVGNFYVYLHFFFV